MEDNETVGLNYEAECERLKIEICKQYEEYEKKLKTQEQFYNQVINDKDKEIEWNKKIIAGILDI